MSAEPTYETQRIDHLGIVFGVCREIALVEQIDAGVKANRLIQVTSGQQTVSYAYNGLGDRLAQTVNGVTERYHLDLNTGLTQVLADEGHTYLYGLERIAQVDPAGVEYFLGDALGSVRQVVGEAGAVRLAKSYEPYGEVLSSAGSGASSYGFTGEWTDGYSELVYLRSRMYSPGTGRFLTRDLWQGNDTRPLSLNGWNYVEANPINFVDPSGMWRWWLPSDSLYHWQIEDYYEQIILNPSKQLEFPIPGTGFRHPDMFNSLTGDVYEIEPIFLKNNGMRQVLGYVGDLNRAAAAGLLNDVQNGQYLRIFPYDWNTTSFHVGIGMDWPGKYRKPLSPAFPFVDLVADYMGNGVVLYWLEPNAYALVLLGKPIAGIVPNRRLLRPHNWVPSDLPFQPAYAIDIAQL